MTRAITKDKNKNNLMKFAGLLSDKEADEIKREIYEERKKQSRRFK